MLTNQKVVKEHVKDSNTVPEKAQLRHWMTSFEKSEENRKLTELALWESELRYRLLAENSADLIWTVDINLPDRVTYISPSVTRLLGYTIEEARGKTIGQAFTQKSVEMAMKTLAEELQIFAAERDLTRSCSLELEMIHKDGHIVPVDIKFSYLPGPDGQPTEILSIVRDITERKEAERQARQSTEKLVKAMEDTMQAMAMIVEMRDPYTAGHQRRVTQLACAIAREIGLSEDRITGLRLASLIHDIGKVRVPAEILTNPDGLSDAEFSIIRMHPLLGYEILKTLELPWPIAQIIHQHHERLDGSGYPDSLIGTDIIQEARILAVADVVEAIASHRPYRPARGIDKALEEISQKKGRLYDPDAVDGCLKLFREKGFEFSYEAEINRIKHPFTFTSMAKA